MRHSRQRDLQGLKTMLSMKRADQSERLSIGCQCRSSPGASPARRHQQAWKSLRAKWARRRDEARLGCSWSTAGRIEPPGTGARPDGCMRAVHQSRFPESSLVSAMGLQP